MFLYDADCGFCTRTAQLGGRVLRAPDMFQPWQAQDLDALGLTEAQLLEEAVFWTPSASYGGAQAVAHALIAAGGLWVVLGRLLTLPGVRWVAGVAYRFIAHNRYRLPGSTCEVPPRS